MSDGYHFADETIKALLDDPIAAPELFTAYVTAETWPTCKIRKTGATTGGDQLTALCIGGIPRVGDRVICCWIGGEPVVLLPIGTADAYSIRLDGDHGIYGGTGSPEGVVTATQGSIYIRSGGTGGVIEYTKVSGSGNTGWIESYRATRRKTKKEYQADPGATTFSNSCWAAAISLIGTLSNVDSGTGNWIQAASPATINTIGAIQGGTGASTRFELSPDFSIAMRSPSNTSGGRWWYGCFSGDPTTLDDPSVSAGFGFRHSSAAGDTTYKAYTNDASGGGTITDTGISSVATSIAQELRAICDGSGVSFYIGGSLVARHTTNLPPASTALKPMATVTSLTASTSKAVRVGRITVEQEP